MKAVDTEGEQSAWSEIRSFCFDLTAPIAPLLVSPIDDVFEFDSSVTFEWQAVTFLREVPSPVTYVIQVDTTSGFASSMVLDTTSSTTTTLELPLVEYYYYWHVKAYDAAGNNGPYSGNATFKVDLYDPLIEYTYYAGWWPGPFDIFSQVTDTWGIDEVIMHYKRQEDPAFFPDTMTEGPDDWYRGIIPALTGPADTVKYYITAKDDAGKESRDPPTGYHYLWGAVGESPETVEDFSFSASNLTKSKAVFRLSLPKNCLLTLEIFDISGRLIDTPFSGVKSAGTHEITWSPERIGIYFYSLKLPWKTKTGKIITIR